MPALRSALAACALAILLLGGAGAAAATPEVVYADYAEDGVIDGDHSTSDLLEALDAARGDAQYGIFAEAVQEALDRAVLGRADPVEEGGGDRDGLAGGTLPEPRDPGDGGPPWPLVALSGLAGALMLSGMGSSVYRRVRRGEPGR